MAQAFADYLALEGIKLQLNKAHNNQLELYVADRDYHQAKQELELFIKNPQDKRYLEASWQRNPSENPLTYHSEGKNPLMVWLAHGGWLTHSVLLLNIAIFILAHFTSVYQYLAFPAELSLTESEPWRWITPAFMHFSTLHIVFNLLWWWLLGGKLEKQFGTVFLLLFMSFTALISNFAQYLAHFANNFGGLSGVVYALLGFCWLYGRMKPGQSINLSDGMFGFSLIWLVLGFADMLWINTANQAHLAGLLAGLAFAWLWAGTARKE